MTREVSIEAGAGVYRHFRGYDLDSWTCLGEFVDNSLGSYLHKETKKYLQKKKLKKKLKVEIYRDTKNKRIIIKDNAGGISETDLDRALKIGDRPQYAKGFNEFGVGMKMASFWFAPKWTITTSALGETDEKQIIFDVDDIELNNRTALPVVYTKKVPEEESYTYIELEDIYEEHWPHGGKTLTKIREHLSSMYRRQTKKGTLHLTFHDGETEHLLDFEHPEILNMPYVGDRDGKSEEWKLDINFQEGDKVIDGWVAILAQSSGMKAGFTLLRRERVIEGQERSWKPDKNDSDKNWIWSGNTAPKARLFGELNFKGFEVSNNKSKIQWGLDKEDIKEKFLAYLKSKIKYKGSGKSDKEEGLTRFWIQLHNHTNKPPQDEHESFLDRYDDLAKEIESQFEYSKIKDDVQSLEVDESYLDQSENAFSKAEKKHKSIEFQFPVSTYDKWLVTFTPVELDGNKAFFDLDSWETSSNPKVLDIKWDINHPLGKYLSSGERDDALLPTFQILASICIAELKLKDLSEGLPLKDKDNNNQSPAFSPELFRANINKILSSFAD